MDHSKERTIEEDFDMLLKRSERAPALSILDILEILSGKGRPLLLIFLTLPFCFPLQIPGLSTPFGIIVAFLGLRMTLDKHLHLPQFVAQKMISSKTIHSIAKKSLWIIQKLKRFTHPRLPLLFDSRVMKITNGIVLCILGIFLALPLPIPLSNLSAGWSIFFISLGLLENDGLFVLLGYLTSIITAACFILILLSITNL